MSATRRAAFLDRDGTIIEDRHFLARPEFITLRPGAVSAIRRLNDAGVLAIVITNQSGIARGLISIAEYEAVRAGLDAVLAAEGARLDATYHCPHYPDIDGPCACRKPGVLLYERAIAEYGIDATGSAFIGDRWRDVAPGLILGGRPLLVPSADTSEAEIERARVEIELAPTLEDAVTRFLSA
jgi:D-glycero-D-manno-heptose 1,7-bisphosphate phosphatase